MSKFARLFGDRILKLWWRSFSPDAFVIIDDHVISGRLMFNNENYIQYLLEKGILTRKPEFAYNSTTSCGLVKLKVSNVFQIFSPYAYIYLYPNNNPKLINFKNYDATCNNICCGDKERKLIDKIPNIQDCEPIAAIMMGDNDWTKQLSICYIKYLRDIVDSCGNKCYDATLELYPIDIDTGKINKNYNSGEIIEIKDISTYFYRKSNNFLTPIFAPLEITIINSDLYTMNESTPVQLVYSIVDYFKFTNSYEDINTIIKKNKHEIGKVLNIYEISEPNINCPHLLKLKDNNDTRQDAMPSELSKPRLTIKPAEKTAGFFCLIINIIPINAERAVS